MTSSLDAFLDTLDAEAAPAPEPEIPAVEEIVVDTKTGAVRQAGADSTGAFIAEFKAQAERSLFTFAYGVLGRTYLTRTLHEPVCGWLTDFERKRRKLLLMPREHCKTSIIGHALPLHMMIQPRASNIYLPDTEGRDTTIVLSGETEDRVVDAMRVIQSALESATVLRGLWPHVCWDNPRAQSKKWNDTEIIIRHDHRQMELPDPTIRGIGVGGAITGAHPRCIAEGTLVYTSNGLLPIQDVRPAMRVLTHTGHHREVLATASRQASVLDSISVWGFPEPIRCTPDHRLLVYKNDAIQWVEARNIHPWDMLAIPIPSGRTRAVSRTNPRVNAIMNNPECWRLIGYWLAEGAASQANAVRLTFGKHEEHTLAADAARIVRDHLGAYVSIKTNHKTSVVSFADADFKSILAKFGTHAHNKYIPPLAIASKRHFRVEMVRGYFRGDGHKKSVGWSAGSVSLSLLAGMQLVLASLDIPTVVQKGQKPRRVMFREGEYDCKQSYQLSANHPLMDLLMGTPAKWALKPCRLSIIPGFILAPAKAVSSAEAAKVYDLQVAKDESFVIVGGTAHNCLIKDDLATLAAANSPTVMQSVIQWHVASRALINKPECLEFMTTTRWAGYDWARYMMENDKSVEYMVRQGIEAGLPIYPEGGFTLAKFEELRSEFGVLFPFLYLNTAVGTDITDFDMAQVRTFAVEAGNLVFDEDERDLLLANRIKPIAREAAIDPLAPAQADGGYPGGRLNYMRVQRG